MVEVKFNDSEQLYEITSFRKIKNNLVILKGQDIPVENTSGFKVVRGKKIIGDYSEYTIKYNILTTLDGVLMLTNDVEYVETEEEPATRFLKKVDLSNIKETVEPLSNEELTEVVGDLMFELSLMQLGL